MIKLAVLGVLATLTYAAGETATDGDVVVITEKNVDEVLKKNKLVFVKYYAPVSFHLRVVAITITNL